MKLWLLLGILSYLSYAISTSIDKYMMNHKYGVFRTNTVKMFFDGVILLIIGLIFFDLNFTPNIILWSLILGVIYALGGIIYFTVLKLKDVGQVIPYFQSSEILLVFVGSLLLFNEFVTIFNYFGVFLILIGVYAVLSETGIKFPKLDKAFFLVLLIVIIDVVYWLLVKKLLFDIKPINLAIMMYFSTTLILFVYQVLFRKQSLSSLISFKPKIPKIALAAFFGAMGTFLIYSALSIGDISKVYPIAGIQSVFIFIIASIFLKEKFYWHRMIGTVIVFAGIFLISL
nr:DMT family transporter [Nanoarchaeota archaeon]